MYLLKLALRPWRLAPFSQVLSAMAVGILLVMAGFLLWMQGGLKSVVARLQGEQVVTAYLNPEVPRSEQGAVVDSVRMTLGSQATTVDVQFVDSHHFIAHLKDQYPELSRELSELGPEMDSLIPRYVSISGILPDETLERIRAVRGIESAESSKDRYRPAIGAFVALRWVARLLTLGLFLALLTGLIHLSKMNAYFHRETFSLLKLWGASPARLRIPGVISALWVGMAGGCMALVLWVSGAAWLSRQVRGLTPMLKSMAPVSLQMGALLLVLGCLIGLLAGALGSGSPESAGGAES